MSFARYSRFRFPNDPAPRHDRRLSLTDNQMQAVLLAAQPLPPEKRSELLERIGARLRLVAGRPSDDDVARAVELALRGLVQEPV